VVISTDCIEYGIRGEPTDYIEYGIRGEPTDYIEYGIKGEPNRIFFATENNQ
jgi:hypothetical protein